jgi:hypothetical protein
VRPVVSSGISELDELIQGGLPVGALTELVGTECSGRLSLALSFLSRITATGSRTGKEKRETRSVLLSGLSGYAFGGAFFLGDFVTVSVIGPPIRVSFLIVPGCGLRF